MRIESELLYKQYLAASATIDPVIDPSNDVNRFFRKAFYSLYMNILIILEKNEYVKNELTNIKGEVLNRLHQEKIGETVTGHYNFSKRDCSMSIVHRESVSKLTFSDFKIFIKDKLNSFKEDNKHFEVLNDPNKLLSNLPNLDDRNDKYVGQLDSLTKKQLETEDTNTYEPKIKVSYSKEKKEIRKPEGNYIKTKHGYKRSPDYYTASVRSSENKSVAFKDTITNLKYKRSSDFVKARGHS